MMSEPVIKQKKRFLVKRSKGERILFSIIFAVFVLYALTLIFPFGWTIMNSFKTKTEYNADTFSLPKAFIRASNPFAAFFQNYPEAIAKIKVNGNTSLPMMFVNSIWFAVGASTVVVFFCSMSSYIVAKYKFFGHNFLYAMVLFMMMIPIVGTFPATYKLYHDLHLTDSPLILLAYTGGFGGYFLILYATYKGISWSYAESAMIDGANGYTIYFRIMVPQAMPALFTLWLLQFISHWNDYNTALVYLPSMPTLATGLMLFETESKYRPNWPVFYAGIVLMSLPVIVIFSVFSEKIMTSVTTGGLKG